ncbi:MAG: PorP/SprF family type IX secretion system membrane protein [Saprospiraceae bacterium]
MRKVFTIFILVFFSFISLQAQDRSFSQFFASPLTLNPALTGAFDGRFRVSTIYRDQWRGVQENAFATFSSALDLKWRMGRNTSKYHDYAAIGLMFFADKAGAFALSTTQISISGAYHKALDIRNTQYLSLGFQAGIAQRNFNNAGVTFEDQFNGTTGYTDPTNENLPENNYAYADYSVGINYVYSPRYSRMKLFIGGALHHFLSPSVSFYKHADSETLLPDNVLAKRYSGQISAVIPVTNRVQFLPRTIFEKQDSHMKLDAGGNFRLNTSEFKNIALHIGAYVRPVTDEDNSFRLDAVVGMLGIELNNVLFGLSYDLNMDRIAQTDRRVFEFSIAYLGEYEDDVILCPKF